MIDPVPSGIRGEGKVSYGISVGFVVEVEEDAQTSMCKDGMCGFRENVIVRKTFFSRRESLRCQVLLDGKVRELYYLMASPVDDCDQTGTYGHNRFFCVYWTPICVKCREGFLVELNCKNLRELFDTKRANGHHETSEKSLCILAFLFINAQQSPAVSFVQRLRQVVQDLPNTRRKSATQPVNLADDPAEPTRSCESIGKPKTRDGSKIYDHLHAIRFARYRIYD